MRIIAGTYKGKRVVAPKNLPVRPTTDMAKEALFNILNHRFYFDELTVLDLFAGIGSISFEFASRGTAEITSVDRHFGCVKFISETAKELNMNITTVKSDVFKFLEYTNRTFDIIFADPPYDFTIEQLSNLSSVVFENELLKKNGLLIIEHSKHTDLSNEKKFVEARHYGGSVFSFFE